MSDQIMIGSCPECGHFPSQLVGDAESLDYVIHLPEKDYGCQAGPHKRIRQLESQLEQDRAKVADYAKIVDRLIADYQHWQNDEPGVEDISDIVSDAQRLRNQADEIEKGGSDE